MMHTPHTSPVPLASSPQRLRLHIGVLVLGTLALAFLALCVGADGVKLPREAWAEDGLLRHIVVDIRAPRMLGAWLVGALLGLAGGIAQVMATLAANSAEPGAPPRRFPA